MPESVRTRPAWLHEIGLVCASLPEPPFVQKTAGSQPSDADERHEHWFSDAALDAVVQAGVNVVFARLFSGYGLEFEKHEMERVREFIGRAHARNIKIAAEVSLGAVTPETLLVEEPDAHNWVQVNQDGQHPCRGGQSQRVRPCYNSENYLRYLERVCNLAVDFGADLIHFTDVGFNPEPDTCHCPVCVAGFREFLRRKFGPQDDKSRAAGQARFGHNNFTHTRPPVFPRSPGDDDALSAPHAQEWLNYKSATVSQCLARLSRIIAKRKPDCALGADLFVSFGGNTEWLHGLSLEGLLPELDLARWLSAAPELDGADEPRPARDGRHSTRIIRRARVADGQLELFADAIGPASVPAAVGPASLPAGTEAGPTGVPPAFAQVCALKTARAFGTVFENGPHSEPLETALALNLAFNPAGLGNLGSSLDAPDGSPLVAVRRAYTEFFTQHKHELLGAQRLANVAVLHDPDSLAFDAESARALASCANLLLERSVPFELFCPVQFDKAAQCRAIVLPGCACLSDDLAAKLEQYVNGGGGLVVVGDTGVRDSWRRLRRARVLAALAGSQNEPLQRQSGSGRVASFPQNARAGDIVDAIRYAAGEPFPWSVDVQAGVVVADGARSAGSALLLHVVNAAPEPARGLRCSVLCPQTPKQVLPLSPGQSYEPVAFNFDNGRVFFSFGALEKYVMFRVTC